MASEKELNTFIDPASDFPDPFPIHGTHDEIMAWAARANKHELDERQRIKHQADGKMMLLMKMHNIDASDPDCWKLLSHKLAKDLYLGLQEAGEGGSKKRGRKRKWNEYILALLWFDVEALVRNKMVKSKNKALEGLCIKSPWKEMLDFYAVDDPDMHIVKHGNLKNQYDEAVKTPVVQAFLSHESWNEGVFYEYYTALSEFLNGARRVPHNPIRTPSK